MSRSNPLSDFFGALIADIRHKLVEEPWFGREVTKSDEAPQRQDTDDLGWIAWRDAEPSPSDENYLGRGHEIER
jgi:hypothetical protein